MATMSKIMYFLKESLSSSRHNLGTTIGGVITIFLALFMVGLSIMISSAINNVTQSFEDEVNIRLFISDSATDEQIAAFNADLDAMKTADGNVKSYQFLNKDEVLKLFEEQTADNSDIVDQLDGNPLPRTYIVELRNTEEVASTAAAIEKDENFTSIADNSDDPTESVKYGEDTVKRLIKVVQIIRTACALVIVLLIFISLVFLNNTIRLAILARRKEISIMRLVGASNGFIRGPFIMEGVLQALVGAILAIISISIIRVAVMPNLENMISFLPISVASSTYGMIYLVLIIAGVIVGALGSAVAMRRYLKV